MSDVSDAITAGFKGLSESLLKGFEGEKGAASTDPAATGESTEVTKAVTSMQGDLKVIADLLKPPEDAAKPETAGAVMKAILQVGTLQEDMNTIKDILGGADGKPGLLDTVATLAGQTAVRKSFVGQEGGVAVGDAAGAAAGDGKTAVSKSVKLNNTEIPSGMFDNTLSYLRKNHGVPVALGGSRE